ncbi:MAG TPA: NAD-dependent epimerase/dehydratase family protein [Streptosporangiaceae bacterium]
MGKLRVLFVGGSGIISSACSRVAAASGIDLYVLNRGRSTTRPLPASVTMLRADIGEPQSVRDQIKDLDFDSVVNWVEYTPDQVRRDIELFAGRTRQYVFISSASAYQTPPARLPVTESTPLRNPLWQYSRDKIACEDVLTAAYREQAFPATIVRPSHTYDRTSVPFAGGWTVLGRMLAGQPVIVHGDGTSLWTLTHHEDFARAFVPLLGHPRTLGEAFHITTDDALTWDQIAHALAAALGVTPRIVHVTSDEIAAADPAWGAGLLGDMAHSMVFDNTKVRRVVPGWRAVIPFEQGAREIADWYLADPARQVVDRRLDALMDKLADTRALPGGRGNRVDLHDRHVYDRARTEGRRCA